MEKKKQQHISDKKIPKIVCKYQQPEEDSGSVFNSFVFSLKIPRSDRENNVKTRGKRPQTREETKREKLKRFLDGLEGWRCEGGVGEGGGAEV